MIADFVFANFLGLGTVLFGILAIRYFKPRSKGLPLAAGGRI